MIYLAICAVLLCLVACSVSYIKQKEIHGSKIDIESTQKQSTDISPPSTGKSIVGGIKAIADAVAPAVVQKRSKESTSQPMNDAQRAEHEAKNTRS